MVLMKWLMCGKNEGHCITESPLIRKPSDYKHQFDCLKDLKICRTATVPFYIAAHLKGQVEFLQSLGSDVVLISSPGPELSKLNLGKGLCHEAIEISRSIAPIKDLRALIQLIRLFRNKSFDIVHSTTPKAGLLTALAAWISRVPIRLHTWTGQQWVTLKGPVRFVSKLADRLIGLLNTMCYADSHSQRRFLIQEGIVKAEKISVIGANSLSGVDLLRFNPERFSENEQRGLRKDLGIRLDSRVIVFVGRITKDKGIYELLAAFDRIRKAGYEADLLLIGPLDEECGGMPTIARREIETHPNVHIVGYTEEPEKYLAVSDIFCLPSYREGFGTVVIEAAAMGLPAVGTRINGLIDAIDEDKTGLLIPSHDVIALVNALRFLLDSPQKVKTMGRAARQRCQEFFNAETINHALVEESLRLMAEFV
jgi:glycosyltransferase involved in cell wall biosynthesis